MKISDSTPKRPGVLRIWKVPLGPIFSMDELGLWTLDNTVLNMRLRYKWWFKVDTEYSEKIIAVEYFIGLATETMAGIIRKEEAYYFFEEFHSRVTEIAKRAIFGYNES